MAKKYKKFADDGWAVWIDGDDTSTIYINDWINPKGKSYVDMAIRIRNIKASKCLSVYIPFSVSGNEIEDVSLLFNDTKILQATFSAACIVDYGLHQNTLGADQLRQASLDVMFAAYVEDAMAIPKVNGQENFNVRDLTNSNWVAKQKENMLGNIANRKVETMSREDLGSIFAHNNLKIRDMLTKPASTAPVNKQAEPEPAKVLEEPNRQQNGFTR